ncbi:hypothetical protein CLV88_11575 [Shimia abyssi]|uniref:Uncharacterized protein n=1 Tax=Shimia abyssi TaxID=1662395 RepID=A0A2P8F7P0_9RHOB|nr:hypothetical protein CLV88_11575 [Shimia abyssi]
MAEPVTQAPSLPPVTIEPGNIPTATVLSLPLMEQRGVKMAGGLPHKRC